MNQFLNAKTSTGTSTKMLAGLFGTRRPTAQVFAAAIHEEAISIAVAQVQNCSQSLTAEQVIRFKEVKGDFVMRGTVMEQGVSVDMSCALSSETQNLIKSQITDSIVAWAKNNDQGALAALTAGGASARITVKTILDKHITTSTIQSTAQSTLARQGIDVDLVERNVIIENVTLSQSATMIARSIIDNKAYSDAISEIATTMNLSAESESAGQLAGVAKFYFVIILLVVAVVGVFLYKLLTNPQTAQTITTVASFHPAVAATSAARGVPRP